MLNISELLDDPDFIQPINFGITTKTLSGETIQWKVYNNTCVQSAGGAALQRLDVGERTKDIQDVFTKEDFPLKNGDYMEYKGKKYRCITEDNFDDYGYYNGLFMLYSGAQDNTLPTPDPWGDV